eukprot:5903060-Prymnesium_polylepis.1
MGRPSCSSSSSCAENSSPTRPAHSDEMGHGRVGPERSAECSTISTSICRSDCAAGGRVDREGRVRWRAAMLRAACDDERY